MTAGLMVVELLGFEAGPLWIGLIAEQLIFDAITFRKENHLDIPFWEAFIMSLGFEQDKLQGILEERQLVELSLGRVDRSPGTTSNFYGWALVHVPELKNSRWQPLRKDQIPENIIQKIEAQSAPWIYLHDEEKEADGFKEVRHHAESPILAGFEMVFFYRPPNLSVTLHWEQRIYDAVPSCVTVQFSPGTKNYQEDNTFLASPLGNNSHYKKIVSVISPEETSGFSEAETPVVIKNGLGALYVNNKTFSDSSSQRNIYVEFDAREGHMALNFTTEGLRKIDEINRSHNPFYVMDDKSHYMVTIGVGHKPYPNSIIFPSGNGYGVFSLIDSSQRIISQYIISDNNPFLIRDGAAETRIALLSPAVDNDNSTLYTVSGNSSNIKIQKLIYRNTVFNNSIQFNQYRLINENHIELKGIKKYLQLMLNNIIIRDRLVVSAARVDILYAQGIPNNSRITVGEEVLAFNMLLVGNIIVSSDHTQLQLIGKIPKASDPIDYSKMISDNVTSLYTLKIENLEPIINALPRKNPPGFKFTLPGLQLAWNNNDTISKALLRIEGQLEGQKSFLEMQHDVDTLNIFNSTNRLTTVKINHYTPEAVLDNQLELTDILKPYQANFVSNRTAQDVYSDFLKTGSLVTSNITAYPMDGHILVFLAPEGHQVFHRFTAPGGINLNGIRYTVQGKEIYAVPGDNGVIEGNQLLHYSWIF